MGTGQVAVRRNVWSLDPTEAFASQVTLNYARAVAVMQQRAPNDPTSWTYQANVHGTYDQVPPGAAWNQCQHGTWFFLPWHRMYLYFFEQVVREAIAEAGADPTGWALPYWNYGDGPQPPVNTLPLAFRAPSLPNGAANPLYLPYPLRNDGTDPRVPLAAGINDGGQLPAFYLDYRQAFGYPNYAYPPAPDPGFGGPQTGVSHRGATHGALEQQPHDLLHVLVGGVPAGQCRSGWMSDPDCAARDPIFWLHHANIDRLWKRWLDVAGHADPAQAAWLDRSFRFYDPARREVRAMTAREVLDTVEQLGYGYDDDPPPAARPIRRAAPPERVLAGSASGRRLLGSAGPLAVAGRPVRAAGELVGEAAEAAAAAGAAEADAPHLNLNLEGVDRDPRLGAAVGGVPEPPSTGSTRSPLAALRRRLRLLRPHGPCPPTTGGRRGRGGGSAGARGPPAPREHLHLRHHRARRPAADPSPLVRYRLCGHGGPRRAAGTAGHCFGRRRCGGRGAADGRSPHLPGNDHRRMTGCGQPGTAHSKPPRPAAKPPRPTCKSACSRPTRPPTTRET